MVLFRTVKRKLLESTVVKEIDPFSGVEWHFQPFCEILTARDAQIIRDIMPLAIALQFWPFKRQCMKMLPQNVTYYWVAYVDRNLLASVLVQLHFN